MYMYVRLYTIRVCMYIYVYIYKIFFPFLLCSGHKRNQAVIVVFLLKTKMKMPGQRETTNFIEAIK
jgi:hypothetical protein